MFNADAPYCVEREGEQMPNILIQHIGSKNFFAGPHLWFADPQRALNFGTPLNAMAYAMQHKMQHVQIIVLKEGCPPVTEPVPDIEPARALA